MSRLRNNFKNCKASRKPFPSDIEHFRVRRQLRAALRIIRCLRAIGPSFYDLVERSWCPENGHGARKMAWWRTNTFLRNFWDATLACPLCFSLSPRRAMAWFEKHVVNRLLNELWRVKTGSVRRMIFPRTHVYCNLELREPTQHMVRLYYHACGM